MAAAGLVAMVVSMGIGRFAFTPLLPLMQRDAGLTLTGGSWLAFANYLGYLLGALASIWMRVPPRAMVAFGLLATGLLTLAVGLVHGFLAWWVLRFASGVASAWVLIYAAALTLERLAAAGAAQLFGVVFGGVGAGIVLTGVTCVFLAHNGFGSAAIWVVFGVAALLASAACWPLFKPSGVPAAAAHRPPGGAAGRGWGREAWILIVAYGAFGFGYIIPGTFLPVMAHDLLGASPVAGWFWPILGVAAFFGSVLIGRVPTARTRNALAACYFAEAVGVVLPSVIPDIAGLVLGSLLVGATFVPITMLALREGRVLAEKVSRANPAALMGALTAAFGAGQLVGPPFAGYAVLWFGGFGPALGVAAAGLAAAGIAVRPASKMAAR